MGKAILKTLFKTADRLWLVAGGRKSGIEFEGFAHGIPDALRGEWIILLPHGQFANAKDWIKNQYRIDLS
ncbi:hypothetical protein [Enterobacter sp. Colony194]|uniref:hypothetical protein n=1 Tax=Enterobacter sp. Colony194 TaxID=2866201 RepID=UPI001C6A8AEE|nr:hypothetical protein [Enterobacter sp. Colony194]